MNGSSSARSTPANARRTGKPSPSKPCGAVVMLFTLRARAPGSSLTRGNTVMSLTVTAGIGLSLVQSPRVIELSTTCNLSAFLVKPFLEIQGLYAFSKP